MGAMKNYAMSSGSLTPKQQTSYNRFFVNAFTEMDIDEIVEQGGADNLETFKEVSKKHVKEKGYWEKMFQQTWKSKRDGKVRTSKYQRLGDAIYSQYFGRLTKKTTIREVQRKGKEKTFVFTRFTVAKGERIKFQNKIYKGGQFLPKAYMKR